MTEILRMRPRELDQLRVIEKVLAGELTWCEAGRELGLSRRQVGRKVKRVREEGRVGIIHKLRGRPSNQCLEADVARRVKDFLVQDIYKDFGATLACEKLLELEGIDVSVGTVRRFQIELKVHRPKKSKDRHRSWRERRRRIGELVQLDGSDHDWFEGRGERCVLVNYIDDASGYVLYAEFVKVETTLILMGTTKTYMDQHGRPVSVYVDRDSIYKVNREATIEEQLKGVESQSQFARAMEELGIQLICANSPQAKGRVERSFGVDQDRLVKEMRLTGINTMEAGNEFLRTKYLPFRNKRFGKEPADERDAHRPLLEHHVLENILCIRIERTVMNDYTVRYKNRWFQLLKEQLVRIRPRYKIQVEEHLDGSLHIQRSGKYLAYKEISHKKKTCGRPHVATARELSQKTAWKPAANHPWRNGWLVGEGASPREVASLATLASQPHANVPEG